MERHRGSEHYSRQPTQRLCCRDGKVLVAAGFHDGVPGIDSAELYNPDTGTWSITGDYERGSWLDPTATLLPNGKVLVVWE